MRAVDPELGTLRNLNHPEEYAAGAVATPGSAGEGPRRVYSKADSARNGPLRSSIGARRRLVAHSSRVSA